MMARSRLWLLAILLLPSITSAQPAKVRKFATGTPAEPAHLLETVVANRVEAVLTVEYKYPKATIEEWVVITPRLPVLPGQRNVSSMMSPEGREVKELSPLARPLLLARVPVKGDVSKTEFKAQVTYQAELISRKLVPLQAGVNPPPVKDLTEAERGQALVATEHYNFEDPSFQKWLDKNELRPRDKERDIEFARRVFDVIRKSCSYAANNKLDRHAVNVCQTGKSDCGGLAILFVSACRANGVPARMLVGRFATPGDKSKPKKVDKLDLDAYGGQHATAEFFAQGVGWVPADPSASIVFGKPGHDYFGFDYGNFLTLHIDEDLVLDTIHYGRRNLICMQSPVVFPKGSGSSEDMKSKETWEVRKVR